MRGTPQKSSHGRWSHPTDSRSIHLEEASGGHARRLHGLDAGVQVANPATRRDDGWMAWDGWQPLMGDG